MLNSIASGKWNYDAAAHLALRAGFGERQAEPQKWASQGVDATLEHLLPASPPGAAPTDWPFQPEMRISFSAFVIPELPRKTELSYSVN
jgi:hypothetical protein